jgi:UDP-N-acetylglucosamine 2-epimerase
MIRTSILCCAGTRPEIIKLAPVIHALVRRGLNPLLVDTGQHETGVTEPLYNFFGLQVTQSLSIARDCAGLADLNARLLLALDDVLARHAPTAMVVQGDTASALQGALAAFFRRVPVAHVEAGLRTHDLANPFPEELNRTLIARFARWNFAPTPAAERCLVREDAPGAIETVGNTIVDAVRLGLAKLPDYQRSHPEAIPIRLLHDLSGLKRVVITAHRRENWGAGIHGIAMAVRRLLETHAKLGFIWVLHPNPRVVESVRAVFDNLPEALVRRLRLVPPLDYPDMLWLMRASWLLLTDSGGIQEEAASLGLPVFITRDVTERPEVLKCGAGHLVGTDPARLCAAIDHLLVDEASYQAMCFPATSNPFGDGQAAERIAASLDRGLDASCI